MGPHILFIVLLASVPGGTASQPSVPLQTDGGASPVYSSLQAPVLLSQVNPSYSEQARKKKISGDVQVAATIDETGVPQNVTVVHGLGLGLDEKAVEAVRQYRFKPATRNGVPVSTKIFVNVNFQIF